MTSDSGRAARRPAGRCFVGAALVCLVLVASCTGGSSAKANTARLAAHTNPVVPQSAGCIGSKREVGHATIAWSALRNPIVTYDTTAAKDEGVRLVDGEWHLLFSSIAAPQHWRIAAATSRDFTHWTDPPIAWSDQRGTLGVASPDIIRRRDGTYVVTYESIPGETHGESKIYYRTSRDLVHFSAAKPLARTLYPKAEDRVIDPALADTARGLFLGFKHGQTFEVAYSRSGSLDGPWRRVGDPDIRVSSGSVENYQFVTIDGRWHLLATSNNGDRPYWFDLAGDPADPNGWLHWSAGRRLAVPEEAWNHREGGFTNVNYEAINSSYLCDARVIDGHFYLLYAGSTELDAFGGWGHASIGVARSTDLVHWELPGAAPG